MPLETCWTFNKLWNNKVYYKVASCWLFLMIQVWRSIADFATVIFMVHKFTFCECEVTSWSFYTDYWKLYFLFWRSFAFHKTDNISRSRANIELLSNTLYDRIRQCLVLWSLLSHPYMQILVFVQTVDIFFQVWKKAINP